MTLFRSLFLLLGILLCITSVQAQSEFKYSYIPKSLYEHQLFPVTIIGIGERGRKPVTFTFDPSSPVQPIFDTPLVVHNGTDSFYTFYFQARTFAIRIPALHITTQGVEESFSSQQIPIKSLQERDDYCHVLAADMKIKNSQASNYDEHHHIVTLSIEAYEANLESMRLPNAVESDIDSLKRTFAKVEALFYVVLPASQKQLRFTYFNTIKKQYVYLEVPVVVEDASVVTQSDLNPKEDNYEIFKKYLFMFITAFFFLMAFVKRDFFYLIFAVISLITLLTFYIPHKKICIKEGASLYILPTSTSTVSTKIDHKLDTMLLGERREFNKIEYKEGIVGWIKNEDLCHN